MGLIRKIFFSIALIFLFAFSATAEEVQMVRRGGVYHLPVTVNGFITLNFILDTGASLVIIPADLAMTLVRSGTVKGHHLLSDQTFLLADGTKIESPRMILQSLKIGKRVLRNIPAAISDVEGPLLLGQSILEKMGPWTFDPKRQVLVFQDTVPDFSEEEQTGTVAFIKLRERIDEASPEEIVELFFQSVARENYDLSWASLSTYSQNKIIQLVAKEGDVSPNLIRDAFLRNNKEVQDGFWASFRQHSEIPLIVPHATYHQIKEGAGKVTVRVEVRERVLPFMVYRENGHWRMGLIESIENTDLFQEGR